ncbi:Di-and tricarboxylate transporter [Pseudomonas citronellolis]|uniref:Di-and tricarboxylate transporter n=1 Tax=Pseudomonas citronellolis TaxID=53408 RepID=A0AAQ1HL04_9PSED|nr:SLC13 family permease [Pseudomonas citronellolis]TGC24205.1 SLC13 family permease [Pseudomonas citronellolis]UXJ53970.1 SLC13 family permease [Pseudomonas citronellolis]GBL54036.1 citrate transporter [Pseudomonas citronellolis]SFC50833.1 Di-and tricarboxylate transporter [Pseudomonas citronellolis]
MNPQLLWVLFLLATAVALFVVNRPRMDVVALLAMVALPLSGVLSVQEALAGFADPSVVLIAALFIIGEGLVRTGVAYRIGEWLTHKAGSDETRLLVLLMLAVAGLGSVMSSTGVVAIFIPVVLSVAGRLNVSPARLMMPLSFAGLISGMLTLVATPPNMVVHSELVREGEPGFGFFSFTPIGLVILVLGVAYMLVARRWLGDNHDGPGNAAQRRSLRDLIRDYQLAGRERRLRIRPDSTLAGMTLGDVQLRTERGTNVIAIERLARFRLKILSPGADVVLQVGDVLLVDIYQPGIDLLALYHEYGLEPLSLHGDYFTERAHEVGMAEVTLPPESALLGKSILQLGFRSQYGLNVVGLRRNREAVVDGLLDAKLKVGDTLLVVGAWKDIRQLQGQGRDFLVLSLPAEVDEAAPAASQAPHALLSLGVMVLLMVSGLVPNVLAALIACLLMGAFRCIDMDSAYRAIHWQSLVLIVGMLPFALALQKTGGIDLAVRALVAALGGAGPYLILASLFLLTALIGLFISNTATAVLMAPVAIATARALGAQPEPFAMIVALAASAAFMTPISSPVNTLVLGPGHYRFGDFVRVGVPFTLLVMIVSVLLVPWLLPLH